MRRFTISLGAASVALLLALTGCAGATGGSEAASSTAAWTIPSTDPTATIQVIGILDPVKEGMNAVLAAFEKDHPTIKVEYEYVAFNDLNSVLDSRMANKDGNPDVFWADQPRTAALATRGFAADITPQFGPFKDKWDPAPYASSSYEDKLYGVPIANSTQLLFYNKDLLDKAGIAHPSADPSSRMTWEKLAADAKSAVDKGAANGLLFGQFDRYYQLEPLSGSLGGSAGATGDSNLTPDVTSDAWVKAMTWYGSIFADGAAPKGVTAEQTDSLFLAGKAAYEVQGPWLLPNLAKSDINWGVAAQPMFAGGKAETPTGSWSLALSPYSDAKEAAAIFMRWMSVDGGGGYTLNRSDPELPATPEAKKVYFARDLFASEEGKKAASIIDFESSKTAVPRLSTVGYVEFEDIMGRAYSDIRNGAEAKATLETATTELKTAWAQYGK